MKFADAGSCQRCSGQLVRVAQSPAWCPSCEWNLNAYDPPTQIPLGWRWFDRLSYRLAFRLDQAQFRRFCTTLPTRPGFSVARAALIVLSLLLVGTALGSLVLGLWLIVAGFPSWWGLLGLVFIGLAALLRPRPGRLPTPKRRLRREQAPSLFALIERVAEHAGTSVPDFIVLDQDYNAAIGSYGWRRQTVLWLGAPLWLTLDPGMRVAVLAHELGHSVNGDPARGRLVEPALNTFRRLAEGFQGRNLGEIVNPNQRNPNIFLGIAHLAMWAVSRFFFFVHLTVTAIASRGHQQAEYLADRISTEVAGTEATEATLNQLLLARDILASLHYSAEAIGPAGWQSLARAHRQSVLAQLPQLQQFSRRSTDLWSAHPPSGLRAQLVRQWPHREPALVLTQQASDHIDRDLAFWSTRAHRRELGTRIFREPTEPTQPI
ncbi:MAG: M48 family metalloprotease [Actinomycetota bacterium]|nr:M48 family metalloprotease [Actinomycetota bacterium]MDQ2958800.1 M48 family metalloprotease [Actinomycetota bacterium]